MPKRAAIRSAAPRKDDRRARLEVSARRGQLVALGLAAFSGQAYDDVSIDEVARRAGISKGLLYHYFPSKKAFYVAVLQVASAQLLDATATDPSLPPLERLERGLDAFLLYAEEHGRAYAALLHGVSADPEVFKILDATRARFQARLLEGLPAGAPGGPSAAAIKLLSRGWVAMVEAATVAWIEHREMTRAALLALLCQTLLAILGVAPAGPQKSRGRKRRGR